MRRGLMAWDKDEIPKAGLRTRVAKLQAAMADAGEDAILLYTNFIRSAAVSWMTAFSPYWADGVLLVPRNGEPLFATTLSKRVGSWIQTVAPIREVVNAANPGATLAKRLAELGARRVAILELDAFPAALYDDIAAALPGVALVDGSLTFGAARYPSDAAERGLMQRADDIARAALAAVTTGVRTTGEAVGAAEKQARALGAEEAYLAIAPDLDADGRFVRLSGDHARGARFALRATIAYKGVWTRRIQTYATSERDRVASAGADAWFATLLSERIAAQSICTRIESHTHQLRTASLSNWLAEAPVGTRPLAVVASPTQDTNPATAEPRVITIALNLDGKRWCGAGLAAW